MEERTRRAALRNLCAAKENPGGLHAQQMLDHHLVERLIVSIHSEFFRHLLIKRSNLLEKSQKGAAGIEQVIHPMFRLGRAEGMHVEANVFAILAVAVALQRAHLIESTAEIGAAERTVL